MQSFAIAHAKLCVGTCKALRGRMQCFASEMGKTVTEIVSPTLDKRIGRKGTTGEVKPRSGFSFPTYGAPVFLHQKA